MFRLRHGPPDDTTSGVPIVVSVEVAASPEQVWPLFAEAHEWPEWHPHIRECRQSSDGPPSVGSTRFVRTGLLRVEETITEFDAPRKLATRVDRANLPLFRSITEVITLECSEIGTRVVFRHHAEPTWWFRRSFTWRRSRRLTEAELRSALCGLERRAWSRST